MRIIGNVVGDRRHLRLCRAHELRRIEAENGDELDAPPSRCRRSIGAVVLDQALERLPGEIEPVEGGIAALEPGHDPERLGIVVEAAIGRHQPIELALAGMAERRVAEIMGERDGLGQILVEPEHAGDRAGDLRHFDRMCVSRVR